MEFLYLIFYACLKLRFLDVETIAGPRRPVPAVSRQLCSNVRGLAANLSDLTVASYQYDIVFCSETFVSNKRHVSELLVPFFCRIVLCRGKMPRARGMAANVRDGYGEFFIIIIIIIIKKGWQCKAGRERLTPYQSIDPDPQYQPIE